MSISGIFKIALVVLLLNLSLAYAEVQFTIASEPSNAKVWIDGIYTHHTTPTDEKEQKDVIELWSAGKHILKLTKTGYEYEGEIELKENERLTLNIIIGSADAENNDEESSENNGNNSLCICPECEKCKKCEVCEEYRETIRYVVNGTCNNTIEKVINECSENIIYKSENKEKTYGLYFLCFALILLVIVQNAKRLLSWT